MPRFSLRTLIVVMLVLPPMMALVWWYWKAALAVVIIAILFGGPDALFIPLSLIGLVARGIGEYLSTRKNNENSQD
jgi:hypothetical protein